MVNCALQKIRSQKQMYPVVNIDAVAQENYVNEDEVYSKIETKELLAMIQKLSPVYRLVFNLYVFEGLKHREIAELLNICEGNSKSNLSDARSILQKAINNRLQSSQNMLQL